MCVWGKDRIVRKKTSEITGEGGGGKKPKKGQNKDLSTLSTIREGCIWAQFVAPRDNFVSDGKRKV